MRSIGRGMLAAALLCLAPGAGAQDKHYRFAHDQQLNTGYSVAYDIFSARLKELSGGKMLIDQYPGAQLGQEPQLLQLVKSGDLDFAIVSSANTATISPQAGVMSLHFLFRSPDHVIKSLTDQKVYEAIRASAPPTPSAGCSPTCAGRSSLPTGSRASPDTTRT